MIRTHLLDSGTTVLIDAMQDVRSFALGVFVRAGSQDEPPARQGMSHFLEHLLFKRTRRRTNAEISRIIDRLGGDVDAFTTKEYTGFYVHALDAHFAEALDLVADVVLAPAFNGEDIETERGVILEEIGEANDNPDDLVHEIFVRSFWETHPLGAPILGSSQTVTAITRRDLYAYYDSRYRPGSFIISLAGRVEEGRALEAIARVFSRSGRRRSSVSRRGGSLSRPPRSFPPPRAHSHVRLRPRKGLDQVHVCLGVEAPAQTSRRRYAAALLDIALGGGMSSRLFQEVREKRGLAYSIGSSFNSYRAAGYETVSAACAPRNLPRLIEVTLRELQKLKRGGVKPRELVRAKENLKSGLILSLESTVSRMSSAARQQFYLGRVETPEELLAKVDAVSKDEVDAEADRLFDGRALSLAVVGNVARLPVSQRDLAGALRGRG